SRDYYVSPRGDDRGPGDRLRPWRTLARISAARLASGSRVWLEGGQTFAGPLILRGDGSEGAPIEIGRDGDSPAHLDAGAGGGIVIDGEGGFRLSNLRITGSGP